MKRKVFMFFGAFLVIYIFNFFIPRLMPGDPFRYSSSVSGEDMTTEYSEAQIEKVREYYGMDKPLPEQFLDTVKNNLHGNFGMSIHYKMPVSSVICSRLPWTLGIMAVTLIISLVCGVVLALVSVRNQKADHILYGFFSALSEIPPFLIGLLFLFLIAAKVDWIPLSGGVTAFAKFDTVSEYIKDLFVHALLPVSALSIVTIPGFYFTSRASFLSVLRKPYLLVGKAKGLSEWRIRIFYILRNTVTPITARLFLSIGTVIGGTLLVENVFAYPGIGTVMREAVRYRDYPMIQGIFLLSAVIVLVSMFLADVLNAGSDRREQ